VPGISRQVIDVAFEDTSVFQPLGESERLDANRVTLCGDLACDADVEAQREDLVVLLAGYVIGPDYRAKRSVVQMGRAYKLHGVSRRLRAAPCCVRECPGKWVDLGRDLLDMKGSVSSSRTE